MEARKFPAFPRSRAAATSSQRPLGPAEERERTAPVTSRSDPTGTATASVPSGTAAAVVKLMGTGACSLTRASVCSGMYRTRSEPGRRIARHGTPLGRQTTGEEPLSETRSRPIARERNALTHPTPSGELQGRGAGWRASHQAVWAHPPSNHVLGQTIKR